MRIKKYLTLIVIISGLIAGTFAGLWLTRQGASRNSASETIRSLSGATPGAPQPQTKGREQAVVTLEEFGDYQCPPCGNLNPEIKKLEEKYGNRLRIIFRHFPLSFHEQAMDAALAAEAAGAQGKFWEMHDLLYERQNEWSEKADARNRFGDYAAQLGLDKEKFIKDLDSPALKERILADQKRGESIDLAGTPSLFINGKEVPEKSMTPDGIRAAIDALLK